MCRGCQKPTFSDFHSFQQKSLAVLKGKMGCYQNNLPYLRKWNQHCWRFTRCVSFYILENWLISKKPHQIGGVPIYLHDKRDLRWNGFFFLDWTTPILHPLNFFMSFRSYQEEKKKSNDRNCHRFLELRE